MDNIIDDSYDSNNSWKSLSPYKSSFGEKPFPSTSDSTLASSPEIYSAKCYCGRVRYEVKGEPESSKYCHCQGCQKLHGAPFEWVSIFHKYNVRFNPESLDYLQLYFYNGELDMGWVSSPSSSTSTSNYQNEPNTGAEHHRLPVKVSCSHCRTPVADEGRNMWLAFTTLFGFTHETTGIPKAFRHSCHLFYTQRCVHIDDSATKWKGHKQTSEPWEPCGFQGGNNEV